MELLNLFVYGVGVLGGGGEEGRSGACFVFV